MTLTLVMPLDAHPVCADPEWLPVVDAAFERQGGPEAHDLAKRACPICEVRSECLLLAMRNGEPGPWGGTSSHTRVRRGGKRPTNMANLIGVHHGRDARTDKRTA